MIRLLKKLFFHNHTYTTKGIYSDVQSVDPWLVASFIILIAFGFIMVASSSMVTAASSYNNGFYFIIRYIIYAFIGAICFIAVLLIPTKYYLRINSIWIICLIIALGIAPFMPIIGRTVNGGSRWLNFGIIGFQASEPIKLLFIVWFALFAIKRHINYFSNLRAIIVPAIVFVMTGLLLIIEPDLGSTVVLALIFCGLLFVAGLKLRWALMSIFIVILATLFLSIIAPYRYDRLLGFLHPWGYTSTIGYQLVQSLIAFGHGGIFGLGFGQGIEKLFYLPEAHTDFIASVIGEETGIIGITFLLILYLIFIFRSYLIGKYAYQQGNMFSSYIVFGSIIWIAIQVNINLFVALGLAPTKGLALPFISYGGSHFIIDMIMTAFILRVDIENRIGKILDNKTHIMKVHIKSET